MQGSNKGNWEITKEIMCIKNKVLKPKYLRVVHNDLTWENKPNANSYNYNEHKCQVLWKLTILHAREFTREHQVHECGLYSEWLLILFPHSNIQL